MGNLRRARRAAATRTVSPRMAAGVIFEYAEPVLRALAEVTASMDDCRLGLSLAITMWNATVLADVGQGPSLDTARDILARMDHGARLQPLLESLIERKRTLYANDRWTVEAWDLHDYTAGYRLRVTPRPAPRQATPRPA